MRVIDQPQDVRTCPASFPQRRLWFLEQLEPGHAGYHIAVALRLPLALDPALLGRAIHYLVQRHEALRTTFVAVDGQPVQQIATALRVPVAVQDLHDVPASEREAEARRRAAAEASRPFDLARGPLLRVLLLRLGPCDQVLLLALHHIVIDGWSAGVLLRELSAAYEDLQAGREPELAPLPLQYSDVSRWQQQGLASGVLEAELAYWRRQLAGLPLLQLPTDRPRPPTPSHRGASHEFLLPAGLAGMLHSLCREERATLFMALLAGFQALLHRYTGQDDLAVGCPVANRSGHEFEGLIGFFVNMLVVRTDLSGRVTFRELLRRVRQTVLEAYSHPNVPFEVLVEHLQPERDPSRNPLFQVSFQLHNEIELPQRVFGAALRLFRVPERTAVFDLDVSLTETRHGLAGIVQYSTDLFDTATVQRLAGHYRVLLEGVAADPDRPLAELPLLSVAERQQLLHTWNATTTAYPREACIHELFEAQAARTPDAIALVYGAEHLSYAELNRRANRLAWQLRDLGVGPEVPVGVCLERSVEMIVAVLAILKAGGAYVPLDPGYPRERLALLLQDAQVPVVLCQQRLAPALPAGAARLVAVDAGAEPGDAARTANVPSGATADNLAYIMYTSGSTGRPKGVSVIHRGVVRLVQETNYVTLTEADVFLQFAPLAFDASTFEIWGCLLHGARLVVMPQQVPSLKALGEAVRQYEVSTLWLTAGLFHLMVDERLDDLAGVRQLLAGGDVLSVPRVQAVLRQLGAGRLINGYGPTESTTFACCYPVHDAGPLTTSVPIGRPIANTRAYVLDGELQPLPIGVPGELYLGGDGLARGYLGRPSLTAQRFLPDPYGPEPGARLYRTGDVARYLPDGTLEFLGRRDHQVKLRGFRIELGEIEATLEQHPAVRQAVVLARTDAPSDRRLVAYVVPRPGSESMADALRRFLQEKLPEYMVPSAFEFLESLPQTSSGKVDRGALPAPARSRHGPDEAFVAPRTPVEEIVAGIWAGVLGLEQVGVHDNFFALGGHSLLATQVLSRLADALQVDLPVRSLFETRTVAGLAERIEAARRDEAGPRAAPMPRVSRNAELPLSFAQQRLWFLHQLEPDAAAYNVPFALHLQGPLDVAVLARCLHAIVQRHEVLRTSFPAVAGRPTQRIAAELPVPLPVEDLRGCPEAEVRRRAAVEARRPFDLAHGPVVRAALLRRDEQEHVFLLTLHHIAADGWSLGVLGRELSALYEAFATGAPSPLPELSIQYADFACWQRQWLQGDVLEAQLAYWKQTLAGAPGELELPTDRPRPTAPSFRGASQSAVLPRPLTAALQALSRREGSTLFMTLLAAFNVLLHRATGQEDLVVGTPIAGRNRVELEPLVGFFVNTLALRTDLAGNPCFRELLTRVRETALEAHAHQDLPFEKLVEELAPERDPGRNPLFQVMFVLQNAPMPTPALPGLRVQPFAIETATAKFDLTLEVAEETDGLRVALGYNSDLFDAATMAGMLRDYQALLEAVAADPDRRLADLPGAARGGRRPPTQPSRARPAAAYVAPRTPVEEIVAGIWAGVLGLEQVGVHDNFFALGGHSLLATQVVSRLRQAFRAELPLRGIFDAPTVAGLTAILLRDPGQRARIESYAERLSQRLHQLVDDRAGAAP